jgi:hypothetical protein
MKIVILFLLFFGAALALIYLGIQAFGGGDVVYPHVGPGLN